MSWLLCYTSDLPGKTENHPFISNQTLECWILTDPKDGVPKGTWTEWVNPTLVFLPLSLESLSTLAWVQYLLKVSLEHSLRYSQSPALAVTPRPVSLEDLSI